MPNQDNANPAEAKVSDDRGVPSGLVYWAIIVGLVLSAAGVGIIIFSDKGTVGALTTCVGFGIILAAFGSRAAGGWQKLTATGAGALAIGLFLLYQHYAPVPSVPEFKKRGQISGDINKIADLRIVDEHPLYTFKDRTTRSIRFIILEKQFKNPRITVQVDTNEKDEGKEFFEMFGDGKAIVERYFANPQMEVIKWTFDYANRTMKDGNEIIFTVPDRIDEQQITNKSRKTTFKWDFISIGRALANGDRDVAEVIKDLNSDSPITRRNARDELISAGTEAVNKMMEAFRRAPNNYRIRLGITYSLTGMLREDPDYASDISKRLTDEDIRLLVQATSDRDKSIRLQATEFLFNLKDRRIVQPSLEMAREAKNPDGVYNSVLILKPVFASFATAEQKRISDELMSSVPPTSTRTRELIAELPKK